MPEQFAHLPVWSRTRGVVAWQVLIDSDLLPWLSRWQWYPTETGWWQGKHCTARTRLEYTNTEGKAVFSYVVLPRMIAVLAQMSIAERNTTVHPKQLEAFVCAIDCMAKVRHVNGEKHDCRVSNLDWTQQKRSQGNRRSKNLFISTFITGLSPSEHSQQLERQRELEASSGPLAEGVPVEMPSLEELNLPTGIVPVAATPPSASVYTKGSDVKGMLDQIFPPTPPQQSSSTEAAQDEAKENNHD